MAPPGQMVLLLLSTMQRLLYSAPKQTIEHIPSRRVHDRTLRLQARYPSRENPSNCRANNSEEIAAPRCAVLRRRVDAVLY